jgi:hypothetical protein
MKAILTRTLSQDKQTLGKLELFDDVNKKLFECKTLELPWLNNAKQKSCIPKGTYTVVTRTSPKYGSHFHVTNVENRDMILIHSGNYFTDILGCILVGSALSDINKDNYRDVVNSKVTLKKLSQLASKGFKLTIQ